MTISTYSSSVRHGARAGLGPALRSELYAGDTAGALRVAQGRPAAGAGAAGGAELSAKPASYLNRDERGGTSPNAHPSYTVEEAAVQITRDGYSWNQVAGNPIGTAVTVTYSFRATAPAAMPDDTGGFNQFTTAQMTAAELSLGAWSDVANITFTRVNDTGSQYSNNGQICMANYTTGAAGAAAFCYYPSTDPVGGDLWVNSSDQASNGDFSLGGYARLTLTHELGHGLGLAHPGDYNAGTGNPSYDDAVYYEDTRQYSLMSYWDESNTGASFAGNYAAAPMLDDIAAIQRLYGANTTTRTGNTIYGFNSNTGRDWYTITDASTPMIGAIWDAGGTDTLDFSGYGMSQVIDLRQGNFSSTGGMVGNVAIAVGAVIENAIGGTGADILFGNDVANVIDGHGGADEVHGYDGNDRLIAGGAGRKTVLAVQSTDSRAAPFSLDNYFSTDSNANIDNSTTSPHATAAVQTDGSSFDSFSFTVRTSGSAADIDIDGNSFDTIIELYDSNNRLIASNDDNAADAGSGRYASRIQISSLDAGTYHVRVGSYSASGIVPPPAGIYALNVSVANHALGTLFGSTLDGGNGNDTLVSGAGADTLTGAAGTDTASYENAASAVTVDLTLTAAQNTGGGGADTLSSIESLTGSAYDDKFIGNSGANVFHGGAGTDTVSYGHATAGVTVNLAVTTVQSTGGGGSDTLLAIENLTGTGYNDTLFGSTVANVLDGGNGDDVVVGGAGNDSLVGGAGTDRASYYGAAAGVTVNLAVTTAQNTGGAGTDTLSSIESLSGSSLADTLLGDAAANLLQGSDGADVLRGGAGNDTLDGGSYDDRASYSDATSAVTVNLSVTTAQNTGGAGTDTLISMEKLTGSNFADTLTGSTGNNLLEGQVGDDKLDGGLGADRLSGGTGKDSFRFTTTLGSGNIDTITDFIVADDTVQLGRSVFAGLATGALGANAFYAGAGAAHDADDRIIYNSVTGALLFDRDGTGGAYAAVQFANVGAGLALTNADFTVV